VEERIRRRKKGVIEVWNTNWNESRNMDEKQNEEGDLRKNMGIKGEEKEGKM
jgi:hypothetical protein